MEPIFELLFLYGFPSICVILGMAILIGWLVMPPTGKLLLLKKLGLARGGKGYDMVAYDDRLIQTEAMDVYPEGAMEKKKKHYTLTFYLAKPQDDTANPEANQQSEIRDRDMLPPYLLDGVLPIFFSHMSKAIATNPKVLTALRLANRTKSKKFDAEAVLPQSVSYIDDGGEKQQAQTVPVNVLLPFDPVDIKKNFPSYWQQSNIDATKKRHQSIGYEKAKKEYKEYIWPIVILAAVGIAALVIVALATGLIG